MNFVCFPSGSFCTGRLIIFSAHEIGGRSGQGGCGKYARRHGEEDFQTASKAVLDRTGKRQSNFAEKNNRLAEWNPEKQ